MESVSVEVAAAGIAVGWVHGAACAVGPCDEELWKRVEQSLEGALRTKDSPEAAARRAAVRDMLRFGNYKPTGRGKPASEYLLREAEGGSFPRINCLVEINNLVSLETLLPISLVDIGRAGTRSFLVRRGRTGEEYAFNPSGQVLSLRDLLLAARMPGDAACATPVKDAQETKTHAGTSEVLGLVYAPAAMSEEALQAAREMARLISIHCGGMTSSGIALGSVP